VGSGSAAPVREPSERRHARSRADHQDIDVLIIRHQEGGAERPDEVHDLSYFKITEPIRRKSVKVAFGVIPLIDPLYCQRHVVGVWPLAVSRTGNRVKTHRMWPALPVRAGRNDADALSLQVQGNRVNLITRR
jgi:hypothetical protein